VLQHGVSNDILEKGVLTPLLNPIMSKRVYSEINLHITWHTKNNLRMISSGLEKDLHSFLRNKVVETQGTYFHAIGGIEDHVHLAISIKPSVDLDNWIGQMKGSSSHEFGKALQWQSGYGIVSFGTKDLKWVINYVLNQKEHHASARIFDRLERIEDNDDGY
jgi:putative transposase